MEARLTSPIIVTGMHRSGTSMTAMLLAQHGVHMGERLIPGNRHNPRGYFEDADFVELQRSMLAAATAGGTRGWPDWGWTEDERFDTRKLASFAPQVQRLLESRSTNAALWGWKDPRSTLLLEFWAERLPEARFLLIYRYPWSVVDSIQRLNAPVFIEHPEYGWAIWQFYNRRLLTFYQRFRERSLLISADRLFVEPEQLPRLLEQQWGIRLAAGKRPETTDPRLFTTHAADEPLIQMGAAIYPGCIDQLSALDQAADLSSVGRWRVETARLKFSQPTSITACPDVSIIMPCYNHGNYLVEALVSVERSAPPGCEVLIVDDGSTEPETLRILNCLDQLGYHILRQPNQGLAAARNHAIQRARGAIILPLDADNRIRPGFIEAALAVFHDQPSAGIVYSARQDFGARNRSVDLPDFDLLTILGQNFIDACALFRREVWTQCGGYDETLHALEDWEFWLHAAKHEWQFHRLEPVYFEYRVRADSMLRTFKTSETARRQHYAYIMAKHFELYQRHFFQVAIERAAYKRRLQYSLSWRIIAYIRHLSNWFLHSICKRT